MLAIAGGKGGCGKTTTTLGLAGALARRGFDPLVVDGDCDMPDIHHRVDLDRPGGIDSVADGETLVTAASHCPALPGVAILTGGKRDSLDAALRRAENWRGPVLVDCAAGTNPDSVRPLRYADRSLVVSTDQPQCIEDAEMTRTIARRLSAPPAGVLLRMTTPHAPGMLPDGWVVAGRIPPAESPLESPRVRHEYWSLSREIFPLEVDSRAERAGVTPSQQRY